LRSHWIGEVAGDFHGRRAPMASWTPQENWDSASIVIRSRASVTHSPADCGGNFWCSPRARLFRDVGVASLLWLGVWTWYFAQRSAANIVDHTGVACEAAVRARRGARSIPWRRLARHMLR